VVIGQHPTACGRPDHELPDSGRVWPSGGPPWILNESSLDCSARFRVVSVRQRNGRQRYGAAGRARVRGGWPNKRPGSWAGPDPGGQEHLDFPEWVADHHHQVVGVELGVRACHRPIVVSGRAGRWLGFRSRRPAPCRDAPPVSRWSALLDVSQCQCHRRRWASTATRHRAGLSFVVTPEMIDTDTGSCS
jgi:hypothetical protein